MATGTGKTDGRSADLLAPARAELVDTLGLLPDRWLLVDVARQRLVLINNGAESGSWAVSTAAAGLNAREGSGGTPPGVHRIVERLGMEHPPGTEFESRVPTGRILPLETLPQDKDRDLILSRILTLAGCRDGVNRGPGVDSQQRYIYLHGTNREDLIGHPVSHGCIRMTNRDIIEVCELVREGDPVVII